MSEFHSKGAEILTSLKWMNVSNEWIFFFFYLSNYIEKDLKEVRHRSLRKRPLCCGLTLIFNVSIFLR